MLYTWLTVLKVRNELMLLEENERRRRKGQQSIEVPDLWDPEFYRSCVMEMSRTTGVAVLLSATTTIIGFSVLIMPSIVPIVPIRSIGLTLVAGILHTLVFSMILVPVLTWILRFNKRTNPPMWGSLQNYQLKDTPDNYDYSKYYHCRICKS